MLLFLLACTPTTESSSAAPVEDGLHGRLDTSGARDILYLWGTREEMGYAEGALTCDRIAPLFKDYLLGHLVAQYSGYPYEVIRPVVLASIAFEDGDLREMQALYQGALDNCTPEQLTIESPYLEADSGGKRMMEFEDLLFANAVADFGCSSFSVWGEASATGNTLHGRNFDWAVDPDGTFSDNHILKVYDSSEENARFASLMVPAMTGCVTCVTEEGVSLTMHNEGGLEATYSTEISPRMSAARAALAATDGATDVVAAAEEVLASRRQYTGNNLHLAFPLGRSTPNVGAVVFEYDGNYEHIDGEVTVRWPGEDPDLPQTNAIIATNHYIKRAAPATSGDSFDRAMSLRQDILALSNNLNIDHGRDLLAHVERAQDGLTVHSVLIDTQNRTLEVFVTPDAVTPAPDAEPFIVNLDQLFDGLPN